MGHEKLTFKREKTFLEAGLPPQGVNCPKKGTDYCFFVSSVKQGRFHLLDRQEDEGTDNYPRSHLTFWPGEPVFNLERPCFLPWCDIEQLTCFSPVGQIKRQWDEGWSKDLRKASFQANAHTSKNSKARPFVEVFLWHYDCRSSLWQPFLFFL